jgi:hypothetical protein
MHHEKQQSFRHSYLPPPKHTHLSFMLRMFVPCHVRCNGNHTECGLPTHHHDNNQHNACQCK